MHVFEQILDIHAPKIKIKITKKKAKKNAKPWITNDLINLIKSKDKTYTNFIKEQNTILKEQLTIKYKQLKNEITKLTRKYKKLYYDGYFARNSTNIKKLWVGVNQIINNKSKASANNPTCIEIDEDGNIRTVVDPVDIANAFNLHYTLVADKI